MDILLLAGNGPIDFSPGLPEHYKGKILHVPGAKSATALNGDLIVQDYANTHYNIRYTICRFLQRLSIQRLCQQPGLYARIVLEGDVQHRIHTIGKVRLKKNQYILVKADRGECVTHFERHRDYQYLDLFFSYDLVEPLAHQYPQLRELLLDPDKPIVRLSRPKCQLNFFIQLLVEQLFNSPFEPMLSKLYLDDRAGELLKALLENGYQPPITYKYKRSEIEAIASIKTFIEENYTQHFTIQELSQKAGMNEFDLKAGFRQFYGKGLFEVLLACRMKRALDLVLYSERSMKEIAFEVGYKRLTSFINAFRKFYGHPPGKMRFDK